MKLRGAIPILFICLFLNPLNAFCKQIKPVNILYFFSLQCHSCHKVKQDIFPSIKKRYKDKINIEELDVSEPDSYLRLLELQDKYDYHPGKLLTPTLFIDGKFLVGSEAIETYLQVYIDTALSRQGYVLPVDVYSSRDLIERYKLIRPLGIISAGLIDGINPCAFTVIVFFISFLALQGYGRREVVIIALSFISAVFIIYVLIGLGIFNFLYRLKSYWLFVKIIYMGGSALCFSLAGLAFYDFLRYRQTHNTQGLVLQLPARLKDRIHRIIGFYYRKDKAKPQEGRPKISKLIINAFVVGCLVSLFEAVCTGQVYLPTIVFVLKSTPMKLHALFYLLLYNSVFIFPLLLVTMFALLGVTSSQFSGFARKHMGAIKILMMALFLGLGIFLAWQ